ncbi:MAG TPA: class II aldolase/adducin family protein [Rhodopila sp.]|uniref:class II aldolase/adducin family protein n=1 Tax=Rhodopila sp. TaxID=2480087 RepID=UPI002BFABF2C|nr:class II aldolase/adducin family protein [Rhodopila sp.]HVY14744.1 class II aldolase/adducin family protein [Rhodopila sp.]
MTTHQTAWLYEVLGQRGLIVGSSGNVSTRVADGMMITPSGGAPDEAVSLVHAGMDGSVLSGHGTPSSEWALHAAVYGVCPDARYIVHTHADACTALACLGLPLPAFHYMVLQFGGDDVRCAPYVTFGTQALADVAARAIEGRSACLLANHGMIVCAPTAQAALTRTVLLETLCRQYLLARAAGEPRLLTAAEMADARERFKTYGPSGTTPRASVSSLATPNG